MVVPTPPIQGEERVWMGMLAYTRYNLRCAAPPENGRKDVDPIYIYAYIHMYIYMYI